jgi:hypothetical protein
MVSTKEKQTPAEALKDYHRAENSKGPLAWVQKYLDLADLLISHGEQPGSAIRHRHSSA